MASVADCEAALQDFAAIIASSADSSLRRSVLCRVTDLDVAFAGELRDGALQDVRQLADGDRGNADITLSTTGDDLVGLVEGSLGFASAWASGRLRVDASFLDLLRLRKLL